MITKQIEHKHGASFRAECTASVAGEVLPLAGLTIKSQMRTKERDFAVSGMVVDIVNAGGGRFDIVCQDTKNWPIGEMLWDILIIDADGNTNASETIEVTCVRGATR